jgi:hypothetical protein
MAQDGEVRLSGCPWRGRETARTPKGARVREGEERLSLRAWTLEPHGKDCRLVQPRLSPRTTGVVASYNRGCRMRRPGMLGLEVRLVVHDDLTRRAGRPGLSRPTTRPDLAVGRRSQRSQADLSATASRVISDRKLASQQRQAELSATASWPLLHESRSCPIGRPHLSDAKALSFRREGRLSRCESLTSSTRELCLSKARGRPLPLESAVSPLRRPRPSHAKARPFQDRSAGRARPQGRGYSPLPCLSRATLAAVCSHPRTASRGRPSIDRSLR